MYIKAHLNISGGPCLWDMFQKIMALIENANYEVDRNGPKIVDTIKQSYKSEYAYSNQYKK